MAICGGPVRPHTSHTPKSGTGRGVGSTVTLVGLSFASVTTISMEAEVDLG